MFKPNETFSQNVSFTPAREARMKGSRPLTEDEYLRVLVELSKTSHSIRDRTILVFGTKTGFRISEILSLCLKEVFQNGRVVDRVTVARKHMKKKMEGRTVKLHPDVVAALSDLVGELGRQGFTDPETYIFRSRKGANRPVSRKRAWAILKKAFDSSGLTGKLGTHCMRKFFAKKMYKLLGGDLVKTQKALGHKSVNSTVSYLSVDEDSIDEAILKS